MSGDYAYQKAIDEAVEALEWLEAEEEMNSEL